MALTASKAVLFSVIIVYYSAMFIGVFVASFYAAAALQYPYPLDYGEGLLLDLASRLAAGENIYPVASSHPPYTISNYPPLYPALYSLFAKYMAPSFLGGRLISILSTIGSAAAIYFIINTLTQRRQPAIMSALMFLTTPFIVIWSSFGRVDALALFLSLLALAVLVRWPQRLGVISGALLLTAAVCTRQTYLLAAPLAAAVWLWAHNRRLAYLLATLIASLVLGVFFALNWLTAGGFFFHIVSANINSFTMAQLSYFTGLLFITAPFLIILPSIIFITQKLYRSKVGIFLGTYTLAAMVSAITVGKAGSNFNYFFELIAATSLLTGWVLFKISGQLKLKKVYLALLALQAIIFSIYSSRTYQQSFNQAHVSLQRDLFNLVRSSPGPVLADHQLGLIPLAGRRLYLEPFIFSQLVQKGIWDTQPLIAEINHHKFSFIITQPPSFWPVPVWEAIRENYDFIDSVTNRTTKGVATLQPRPSARNKN